MMHPVTKRITATFSAALLVLLAACDDRTLPTAPDSIMGSDAPPTQMVAINAAPLTLGWLAPLGAASATAPHDVSLSPVVTICRWKDNACAGNPVAKFEIGKGLTVNDAAFSASWDISASGIASGRTTYRITVTNSDIRVGLAVFVDVARGRWALTVPGQPLPLTASSTVPLQFRFGAPTTPPPPLETVVSGVASASTQFFPQPSSQLTPEQTTALSELKTSLETLQTALAGPIEGALTAFSDAKRAADSAFDIAPAGDKADLEVIRLEVAQAGRLLGVSN